MQLDNYISELCEAIRVGLKKRNHTFTQEEIINLIFGEAPDKGTDIVPDEGSLTVD